ncbi:MAG: hypothetical protein ACLTQI_04190 [Slackia sp.]
MSISDDDIAAEGYDVAIAVCTRCAHLGGPCPSAAVPAGRHPALAWYRFSGRNDTSDMFTKCACNADSSRGRPQRFLERLCSRLATIGARALPWTTKAAAQAGKRADVIAVVFRFSPDPLVGPLRRLSGRGCGRCDRHGRRRFVRRGGI